LRARAALLVALITASGCPHRPLPSAPATSVALYRETRAASIPTALRQAATGARLLGVCAFVWGPIATPRDARSTRLLLGDAAIDGWILCGASLRMLDDPRLRVVDVEWSEGQLWSRLGSRRAVSVAELAQTAVRFALARRDKITARSLRPTLVELARAARLVIWELP
jgi:hypothetical protein